MLETITAVNQAVNSFIWGIPAMVCIIGVGLLLSVRTGFLQLRKFPYAIKTTIGRIFRKKDASDGAMTPFQAVCTALAATVGTGNIAGVAGAIAIGGPGAVFWMWCSALLGMCTKFSEVTLAVHFRERNKNGELVGGPMYYIKNGLGSRWQFLAVLYSLFGVLTVFGTGNATQVNTIVTAIDSALLAYGIMDCPFKTYPADVLNKLAVPNPSAKVKEVTQSSSVAEAAAIQSAGGGFLLLEKQKGQLGESNDYTFAVAMDKSVQRQGHIEIVGAGPGDPELISIRGRRMLEKADLILYAGSLVPKELTYCAKPGATVRSSADMNLEEQFILMKEFYDRGKFVVRLHTGDPCIYGAIQEQMAFFDQFHMSYHITPGISSFQAAAAALRSQFTIPEKVQTIILTRGEGRTPMPEKEQLHKLAASQSTMCIYLSAGIADKVQEELLEHYAPTTPVAACYKLTWKDERIYRGELKDLAKIVKENHLTLTTLLVVGDAIDNREGLSRLYADEFKHLFRK